jgi:hypothetical protein
MYIQLNGLAQPKGPLPQPVLPAVPPVPMPTNPLMPKKWCPVQSKINSALCFPYEPNEIAISRTAAGHLAPDVVLIAPTPPSLPGAEKLIRSCEYLIIRDFGVDWRHVKPSAISEPLFQLQLFRFETNKKLLFRIVGYSDCVGVEANNFLLRRGRALNVFKLLGSSARSRVMAVTAAPPATFLTDNSTVAARANTRAVVIEVFIDGSATI